MWFLGARPHRATVLAAVALLCVLSGAASFARAGVEDYEFRVDQTEVKAGEAILSVRLVHKPDGRLVPDAVIYATRLDMAPEGMEKMKAVIAPAPSSEPGVYRFKANLSMEGKWRLSLAAKVQGETGSVEGRLIFNATP